MLGVKDYNPKYYNNIEDIRKNHFPKLRKLIGKSISEVWAVYDCDEDELWNDCPIVLKVEDCQFEMSVFKDNEIAITWNDINLLEELDWYGCKEVKLEWKKNTIKEIRNQFGKPIQDIEIMEYLSETYDGRTKKLLSSEWLLSGIGFKFKGGYFEIFNVLDGYSVLSRKTMGKLRFTSVLK